MITLCGHPPPLRHERTEHHDSTAHRGATGVRRGINDWRENTAESTLHQYQQMSHALRNKPPFFNT